jgi:type IV pilus assembly protein PilE
MNVHATSVRGLNRGFTLIELMVVVVIATILLGIAVPSYQAQVRKSRRTDAKTALLDLAGHEERFLSTNGSQYSNVNTDMGFPALPNWPITIGSGYYRVQAPVVCNTGPCAGGLPAPSFTITAVPVPGSPQAADTTCASFTVDSTGRQSAVDTGGADQTNVCWAQ